MEKKCEEEETSIRENTKHIKITRTALAINFIEIKQNINRAVKTVNYN